jgi:hypothetical protein
MRYLTLTQAVLIGLLCGVMSAPVFAERGERKEYLSFQPQYVDEHKGERRTRGNEEESEESEGESGGESCGCCGSCGCCVSCDPPVDKPRRTMREFD